MSDITESEDLRMILSTKESQLELVQKELSRVRIELATALIQAEARARDHQALNEIKTALDDWATADFSDDPGAPARAKHRLFNCYLRHCLSAETRRQTGWPYPKRKESKR